MSRDDRDFLEATLPHLEVLHRVARHLTADVHGAEDLVQETYLRAFASFATHSGPSTRAWMIAICVNAARSQARRRMRRPTVLVAEPPEVADDRPEVADQVMAEIDRQTLTAALARLAEPQRLVLVLMDIAGLTAAETGLVLGCPRGTVLARAHRGRRALLRIVVADMESR